MKINDDDDDDDDDDDGDADGYDDGDDDNGDDGDLLFSASDLNGIYVQCTRGTTACSATELHQRGLIQPMLSQTDSVAPRCLSHRLFND